MILFDRNHIIQQMGVLNILYFLFCFIGMGLESYGFPKKICGLPGVSFTKGVDD